MRKYKKSNHCSICKRCKVSKKLENIIWESKYFNKSSQGLHLSEIAEKYKLGYQSLLTHVKKHQTADLDALNDIEMNRLAKRAEMKTKILEAKPLSAVTTQHAAVGVWDNVIETAMEQVKSGEIKLNANHLLKAAKDKSDYDIKKKNQDMALMEMMWHFASGEANGGIEYDRRLIEGKAADDYDVAEIIAANTEGWEERPSDIHNSAAGDASTSRSDKVFEGDDF